MKSLVAESPSRSVTFTVKPKIPGAVGRPPMFPPASSESPLGRVPAANENWYGDLPLEAVTLPE
jgi:hypothetical protein